MHYYRLIIRFHSSFADFPNSVFIAKWPGPEFCAVWNCHVISVFIWKSYSIFPWFYNLDSLGLDWCFLMIRCRIWNIYRNITEKMSHVQASYRVVHTLINQFSSVTQSCPTLRDPMNHSMPGLPVHHLLLEFTQTHVHWVSDAIQPSHPLLSPSPPAPNPSQYQGLFQWVNSSHEVAKILEFQLQHQPFQWTPRTYLL